MRPLLYLILILAAACAKEYQAVTLADSLELPAGRAIELRAPEPLRTPALSGDGKVCLELRPPLRQDPSGFAILTSDGRRLAPEVTAVRPDSTVRPLTSVSYLNTAQSETICLGLGDAGGPGPPYVAIRVQADETLRLGAVRWLSTDK